MDIWILHISTEYGDDFRVFKEENKARKNLKEIMESTLEEDDEKPNVEIGYEWILPNSEYAVLIKEPLLY